MRIDPATRTYVTRHRAEGRTTKEIMRSLKRYITRQLYRTLAATHPNDVQEPWAYLWASGGREDGIPRQGVQQFRHTYHQTNQEEKHDRACLTSRNRLHGGRRRAGHW